MKILDTNDFIAERIQVQPITNAELDAAQAKANEQPNKADLQKIYYTLTASSRYVAKWWVKYTDEHGILHSKGFPVKNERDKFISQLEEQGYVCDKKRCK